MKLTSYLEKLKRNIELFESTDSTSYWKIFFLKEIFVICKELWTPKYSNDLDTVLTKVQIEIIKSITTQYPSQFEKTFNKIRRMYKKNDPYLGQAIKNDPELQYTLTGVSVLNQILKRNPIEIKKKIHS